MTLPVRPRSVAEQDVTEIAEFISRDNVAAAVAFLDAVDTSFNCRADSPYLGSSVALDNPLHAGMRVWPVRKFRRYLIFHRVLPDEIEVVRVVHGARDLGLVFGGR